MQRGREDILIILIPAQCSSQTQTRTCLAENPHRNAHRSSSRSSMQIQYKAVCRGFTETSPVASTPCTYIHTNNCALGTPVVRSEWDANAPVLERGVRDLKSIRWAQSDLHRSHRLRRMNVLIAASETENEAVARTQAQVDECSVVAANPVRTN